MKITLVVDFPGRGPAVNLHSVVLVHTNGQEYPGTLASVTFADLAEQVDDLEAERYELQAQLDAIRQHAEQQGCEEMPDLDDDDPTCDADEPSACDHCDGPDAERWRRKVIDATGE